MCRLLAHVSPQPTVVADLIGDEGVRRYQQMAQLHDDGWGTMWIGDHDHEADHPERPVRRHRTPESGLTAARLRAVLTQEPARARVLHLRLATLTMANEEVNTHPFVHADLGLAHNGAIVPADRLRACVQRSVPPAVYDAIEGTTDSELYFGLVRHAVAEGASCLEATVHAVQLIRSEFPLASLNAMVLTPQSLVVVHSSARAPVPWHDFVACGMDPLPLGHDEGYFQLRYRRCPDGSVVVASTGLESAGWHDLPQDTLLYVDLRTGHDEVIPLVVPSGQDRAGADDPARSEAAYVAVSVG